MYSTKVPKYYLLEFLLPSLKQEINSWDVSKISRDMEKTFGSPLMQYLFRKLIEYCENNIDGGIGSLKMILVVIEVDF